MLKSASRKEKKEALAKCAVLWFDKIFTAFEFYKNLKLKKLSRENASALEKRQLKMCAALI